LDKLKQWSDIWQMQFNVDKCKAIHFGAHNTKFTYNIDGIPLENTETERDLGIIVSDTLKSTDQCAAAYNKANRILGLIKRTVVSRDPSILVALYKSLVRPHLEFCCSAWSPHYKKDRTLIERIQHRFTRLFKDLQKLDYSERLNHLGLWTLEERRNRADLIEVFKLCKGLTAVPVTNFFEFDISGRTRGHSLKLLKKHCSKDVRKYFFSYRVINRWNSLTEDIIRSPSINSFKKKLQKLRNTRMGFFLD